MLDKFKENELQMWENLLPKNFYIRENINVALKISCPETQYYKLQVCFTEKN